MPILPSVIAASNAATWLAAGILVVGSGGEPQSLDPNTQVAQNEYLVDSALFEPLVNLANDGRHLLPGVARSWEISPDGLTYTFHLRDDARWSDGTAVTAEDVVFSFGRCFDPAVPCPSNVYGIAIEGAAGRIQGKPVRLGVRASDPRTVVIHLANRAAYFLYAIAGAPFVPVPRHILKRFGAEERAGTGWDKAGNLVSNGAFMLKTWSPGREIVAVRNPYYWGRDQVRLNGIRFLPLDDASAEERAFRTGQIQITATVPPARVAAYRAAADARLHLSPIYDTVFVVMNTQVAPFGDPRIRRALALALDREHIVPKLTQGLVSAGHTLTRPGTDGYQPPLPADYDPARARALLEKAGHPRGSGLPKLLLQVDNHPPFLELAEAFQEAWKRELGIEVAIEQRDHATGLDDLYHGHYQIALSSYDYGVNAPEAILMICQSASDSNEPRLVDLQIDEAWKKTGEATTLSERFRQMDVIEQRVSEDAGYCPVGFLNQANLVSPEVHGWIDNPVGMPDWRDLWVGAP